jgi:pilus assembly protein Flp/PilA
MQFFRSLVRDESGATAIEYGLICALIAVAGLTALQSIGGSLNETYGTLSTSLQDSNEQVAQ